MWLNKKFILLICLLGLTSVLAFSQEEFIYDASQVPELEHRDKARHQLGVNLDSLIAKGTDAIDDMLSIARQSEKARDCEVAGNMIKTMVDASKDLLEIQKTMRTMTTKKEGTTNIKNAVFVGSTTELLRAMRELKDNDSIVN